MILGYRNGQEAERLLRTATQLDSNYHEAHGRLGILLLELGRYSEAEAELKRAIEIDPTDAVANFYLSRAPGGAGINKAR
jgi:Flp pilus assembly protein TadD